MDPYENQEASGPGLQIKKYIEQEWTSEGFYCRSENDDLNMFEIVLPQICKDFGAFMQDLLACGISDIEFRADSKETRLLVYASGSLNLEYFQTKTSDSKWKKLMAMTVAFFVCMILFLLTMKETGKEF